MRKTIVSIISALLLLACGNAKAGGGDASDTAVSDSGLSPHDVKFDADSAYGYVARQVEFGPRVPGSEAHRRAGDWIGAELRRHGVEVTEQKAVLTAFDGTRLPARNFFGRINPDAEERVLLLAHWDCRPWADKDPDKAKRRNPVDGANDGASGVGVILEIARQLKASGSNKGVDILFVDAEDWGEEDDEDSWALGARYFMEHLPVEGYAPSAAILLDMVGGEGATFYREYFSQKSDPALCDRIWNIAATLGHGDRFVNRIGGAITDDHVQLIEHGIPAIDIIEFNPGSDSGFNPRWHTASDNIEGIDRNTLKAVGETVGAYLGL